jgi:hypothetical protein
LLETPSPPGVAANLAQVGEGLTEDVNARRHLRRLGVELGEQPGQ